MHTSHGNDHGNKLKIAMIGVGSVGGTLAKKWGSQNHFIYLGVRDAAALDAQKLCSTIGSRASLHSPREAAARADVICVATPWSNTQEAVAALGDLSGKIVIDCTNPLKRDLSGLTHGLDTSGAEQVASWVPNARVVKCFNTVGFNIMADPVIDGRRAVMFYCGDNSEAKAVVRRLVEEVGFEAVDVGGLASARLLEPFALLWISLANKFGLGRNFGFGLLRR